MKGVEQMIGTVLIIAAVVVVGVLLFMFAMNMFSSTSSKTAQQTEIITGTVPIQVLAVVPDYKNKILTVKLTNAGSATLSGDTTILYKIKEGDEEKLTDTVKVKDLNGENKSPLGTNGLAPGKIASLDINASKLNLDENGTPHDYVIELQGKGIQSSPYTFRVRVK